MVFRRGIVAVLAGAALAACGGGSSSSQSNTPGNITISAQLVSGSVTTAALTARTANSALVASRSVDATALGGYQLYCVTFQNPPAAASGTADASGNVSVTLAAKGVAFGCFVRDASGNTVATLSFQQASTTGTTLTAGGDTTLGSVTVDTTTGLASASVPSSSGTVASTPSGATCPTGYWIVQTGTSDCAAGTPSTARVWVTPAPGGGYLVSIIHGPSSQNNGACGYDSYGSVPATYSGGKLTLNQFNTNSGSNCPNQLSIVLTPDSSCSTATASGTFTGCGSCGNGNGNYCSGNGTGTCGNMTCSATWQGARQ